MKKKIVQKFVKRIEVGQTDVKIHWLVDEEHYQNELNLRSNSPASGENGKISVVGGSYNLINGAVGTIRTCDLLIRSQVLYPTKLRLRK